MRLARAASLPSVAALGALGVLGELRAVAPLEAQVGVLLALALPHAAVVRVLDRRRS